MVTSSLPRNIEKHQYTLYNASSPVDLNPDSPQVTGSSRTLEVFNEGCYGVHRLTGSNTPPGISVRHSFDDYLTGFAKLHFK